METDVSIIDYPFGSSLCYWNSSSGLLAPISLLVSVHQSGDNSTFHSQPSDLFGQRHPEDQTFVVPTMVIDGSPGTITEEANVGRRSHDVHVLKKNVTRLQIPLFLPWEDNLEDFEFWAGYFH